ncbi:hypothetical protein QTA56_07570 [Acinetobacter sp. VNH17]|uniref:Uncharacterized protein n=1 Tax=Acinetobacter thutiue TaxID=2998078 RepID=A0ABT7WN38_9GAMM|nr:hypothetical protein [Acinetobacter thutiue]MCY6411990.1 hypothetical protein [Acinetobacter thutiue]MDN0014094.1 hypothetical protein [Acinetobacter thutiue]
MRLSVVGVLAVAMTVLVKDEAVKCKSVELSDLTTGDMFAVRQRAKDGEFWALHEMAAKTQLVDDQGRKHTLTYEMLHDTSSANFKKLEELDYELQKKLNAESLGNPSS